MGIHLGRVGHIGIHVSDVDRSIDFYRKVLGLKITGRWVRPTSGAWLPLQIRAGFFRGWAIR